MKRQRRFLGNERRKSRQKRNGGRGMKEENVDLVFKIILVVFGWSIMPILILKTFGNEMLELALLNPFNFLLAFMFYHIIDWEDTKDAKT